MSSPLMLPRTLTMSLSIAYVPSMLAQDCQDQKLDSVQFPVAFPRPEKQCSLAREVPAATVDVMKTLIEFHRFFGTEKRSVFLTATTSRTPTAVHGPAQVRVRFTHHFCTRNRTPFRGHPIPERELRPPVRVGKPMDRVS